MKQIGTIEILRPRIYNLDAECNCSSKSTVVVSPGGVFPLYSDGMSTFWVMKGRLNMRGAFRLGDGTFMLNINDQASEIEVQFPSKHFGPEEWADLLKEPSFTEGDPEQRVQVSIFVSKE